MKLIGVDFETYYDDEYNLKNCTTEEYIRHPKFQIIGVSIKPPEQPARWFSFKTFEEYARLLAPLREHAIVAHNALFDAAILAFRLGVHPKMLFDTLSMARAIFGNTVRNDLGSVASRLKIGVKGEEVVHAKGKRLEDFNPHQLKLYGAYCCNDTELCVSAFGKLLEMGYPKAELAKVDVVLRMFTQPIFKIDPTKVERELELDAQRKVNLMAKLPGTTLKSFRSAAQFADLLRRFGVDPPMKVSAKKSAKKGYEVLDYAFAKNDADFVALLNHEDPMVQALVQAKLGVQSSQRESRAGRFMGIFARNEGWLPVPLAPSAAHTQRLGGTDSTNMQNLQRTSKKDPDAGLLRQSIVAPEGHLIFTADEAQIEARLLCGMAGQMDKVEAFAQGRDVYSEQATVIYGRHVDRKNNPDDFVPGFIGKAVVLGCGYQLGHLKFGAMIYVGMLGEKGILFDDSFADQLGVDVLNYIDYIERSPEMKAMAEALQPMALSWGTWMTHLACASRIIKTFRDSNEKIPLYWKTCQRAIEAMYTGTEFSFGGIHNDVLRTEREAIVLPSGLRLLYPHMEFDGKQYSCLRRKGGQVVRVKLYGGLIAENSTQALAGIVVSDGMVKIDRSGCRVGLQVHDEVVGTVRREDVKRTEKIVTSILTEPPKWMPYLPLSVEFKTGINYGAAK